MKVTTSARSARFQKGIPRNGMRCAATTGLYIIGGRLTQGVAALCPGLSYYRPFRTRGRSDAKITKRTHHVDRRFQDSRFQIVRTDGHRPTQGFYETNPRAPGNIGRAGLNVPKQAFCESDSQRKNPGMAHSDEAVKTTIFSDRPPARNRYHRGKRCAIGEGSAFHRRLSAGTAGAQKIGE